MNYQVKWRQSALDELTRIWLNSGSSDRQAITDASHVLEKQLSVNPEDVGESRPDGRRIHFSAPLGVIFRVKASLLRVLVTHVWRFD